MPRFNRRFPVAWYTAQANVAVSATSNDAYSIKATQSTATVDGITIKLTVAKDETFNSNKDVQLSYVYADDYSGENAATLAGKVVFGAMKNGVELEETIWDGDNATTPLIAKYVVTGAITSPANVSSLTGGQKEALKNASYDFAIKAEGNAVILAATSLTEGNVDAKAAATTPKVRVTFNSTGDGIASCTPTNPFYAIRTNNHAGKEYVNGTEAANSSNPGYGEENTSSGAVYHVSDAIVIDDQSDITKVVG